MKIEELLLSEKKAIVADWFERTVQTYPKDAARFFRQNPNRFANPVGQTLRRELESIFDTLLADASPEEICKHLDEVIKVRAVQEFTPGRAMSFVFCLKQAVVAVLQSKLKDPDLLQQWFQFESKVDQLALFGFDIYTKNKQHTYEIRVEEIKRQVAGLIRRSGMFVDAE